ncbi:hypothetical protein [Tritonibacter scottomollicae]|uniref:hypothetical protein n=1 Tax=Tritonibacter scottomollicae TaxID=483013 RepID=UPI003BAA6760
MDDIPILIPESCVKEISSLADVSWYFGVFFSDLEERGAVWSKLPAELKEISALNTFCGGRRSNGSRTSLRNLVMLEGLDFTRAFLTAVKRGASRLGWNMSPSVFDAELNWLDEVGEDAPRILDDYDVKIPALESADDRFFDALKLDPEGRTTLLAPLSNELKERYAQAENNYRNGADGHYSRIYLYIMAHPALSIVPMSDEPNRMMNWYSEVEKCAKLIKQTSS